MHTVDSDIPALGPVGIGVIGAGNIGHEYLDRLSSYPDLRVLIVGARDQSQARAKATKHGVATWGSVDDVLNHPEVEVVLNLTTPASHADVSASILAAGKHVWTEKPLCADRASAQSLMGQAKAAGLRIGVAPETVLGGGLQSAKRAIERGEIGVPLFAQTSYQWQGPELFHPNPAFFYARGGGPLLDVGPYYVSALVHLFGPVAEVAATAVTPARDRAVVVGTSAGDRFPVEVPTTVSVLTRFESGATAQSFYSFDSPLLRHGVFEVTGSEATAVLPNPVGFDGSTHIVRPIGQLLGWPPIQEHIETTQDAPSSDRGIGIVDMARAMREGRPHLTSSELGYHVLDVLLCIEEAIPARSWVTVASSLEPMGSVPATFDPRERTLHLSST